MPKGNCRPSLSSSWLGFRREGLLFYKGITMLGYVESIYVSGHLNKDEIIKMICFLKETLEEESELCCVPSLERHDMFEMFKCEPKES